MMRSESLIEGESCRAARKEGWLPIKLAAIYFSGLPDRMFLGFGQVIFIEYKTLTGKLSKRQIFVHKLFKKYGITVYIARSKKETLEILNAQRK